MAQQHTTTKHKRLLSSQDYKTLSLSAFGGALEFYDFIIFVFFSKVIGILFFPADMPVWLSQLQTFGIFAAGYLARPFGGIVMAHFGDLFGRKRMFTLSILLMAIPTLLIGCLPTYAVVGYLAPILLLILRVCQGLAVGGEIPGAWTFVAEHVPKNKVGLACGTLTSGLTLGIFLGSLVSIMMQSNFNALEMNSWVWRIPFIVGGIFGFIAMYLRRWLKETPIFLEMQKREKEDISKKLPVWNVLSNHLPQTTISILLTWVLSAGIMVIIVTAHVYLQGQFGFSEIDVSISRLLATAGLALGCVFYGYLADKFSIGKIISLGCIFVLIATIIFLASLSFGREMLYITYPIVGFSIGIVGAFPYYMVRAFPAKVRYSGVAFSFNISYAITGALTAFLIPILANFFSKYAAGFYVMGVFVFGALLGWYIIRKEKELAEDI
ncbi:MFS transporter [Sulfurospirillum oryzae]|uniref:MFS transporter n=1 Tax=Sulfurospirillum oryzae TaxID=2976535 RepID=UPI0021E7E46E|nr:MFS transporter [Sulfurospirillum oryzae]